MNVKDVEMESFLLREVCATIPNILRYLATARSSGTGELVVPTEHVDAIVATLRKIDSRSRNLLGRMLDTQTKMAGVSEALRWITDENAMSA